MTSPKPPVPSANAVLLAGAARPEYNSEEDLSLEQCCWLAGYHARDAEVAKAEDFVTATRKDNESLEHCLDVKVARIAELEAEVAELRDSNRALSSDRDAKTRQLKKGPRRTPELTERVALRLLNDARRELGWPHATESNDAYRYKARLLLDLVFGEATECRVEDWT